MLLLLEWLSHYTCVPAQCRPYNGVDDDDGHGLLGEAPGSPDPFASSGEESGGEGEATAGGSNLDQPVMGAQPSGGRAQMCLVTAAVVVCTLRLRFGPSGYDSEASEGTRANLHAHERARRGVAAPLTEDVKRVLHKLMAKARAGELSDAFEWVRLRVPVRA